jgi:hypothetical protein
MRQFPKPEGFTYKIKPVLKKKLPDNCKLAGTEIAQVSLTDVIASESLPTVETEKCCSFDILKKPQMFQPFKSMKQQFPPTCGSALFEKRPKVCHSVVKMEKVRICETETIQHICTRKVSRPTNGTSSRTQEDINAHG